VNFHNPYVGLPQLVFVFLVILLLWSRRNRKQ
jgi:hypothetical protein